MGIRIVHKLLKYPLKPFAKILERPITLCERPCYPSVAEGMRKAPSLENFEMTYHPATCEDFISLFRNI